MLQRDLFGNTTGYKRCPMCGRYKELYEFNGFGNKIQSYCKACQKVYRSKHPDKEYKQHRHDHYSLSLWDDMKKG